MLGAMADALLTQATEADIQEHPDRHCGHLHLAALLSQPSDIVSRALGTLVLHGRRTSICISKFASTELLLCRYLAPLKMAAAALEDCEDWAAAAEAQHLIALVYNAAHLQPQRNLASSAWQRLAARACSASV